VVLDGVPDGAIVGETIPVVMVLVERGGKWSNTSCPTFF
jgi:hypothetical protein